MKPSNITPLGYLEPMTVYGFCMTHRFSSGHILIAESGRAAFRMYKLWEHPTGYLRRNNGRSMPKPVNEAEGTPRNSERSDATQCNKQEALRGKGQDDVNENDWTDKLA